VINFPVSSKGPDPRVVVCSAVSYPGSHWVTPPIQAVSPVCAGFFLFYCGPFTRDCLLPVCSFSRFLIKGFPPVRFPISCTTPRVPGAHFPTGHFCRFVFSNLAIFIFRGVSPITILCQEIPFNVRGLSRLFLFPPPNVCGGHNVFHC